MAPGGMAGMAPGGMAGMAPGGMAGMMPGQPQMNMMGQAGLPQGLNMMMGAQGGLPQGMNMMPQQPGMQMDPNLVQQMMQPPSMQSMQQLAQQGVNVRDLLKPQMDMLGVGGDQKAGTDAPLSAPDAPNDQGLLQTGTQTLTGAGSKFTSVPGVPMQAG